MSKSKQKIKRMLRALVVSGPDGIIASNIPAESPRSEPKQFEIKAFAKVPGEDSYVKNPAIAQLEAAIGLRNWERQDKKPSKGQITVSTPPKPTHEWLDVNVVVPTEERDDDIVTQIHLPGKNQDWWICFWITRSPETKPKSTSFEFAVSQKNAPYGVTLEIIAPADGKIEARRRINGKFDRKMLFNG